MSAPKETPPDSDLQRLIHSSRRVLDARSLFWVELRRGSWEAVRCLTSGETASSSEIPLLLERLAILFPDCARLEQKPLLASASAGQESWAVSAPLLKLPDGGRGCLAAIRMSDRPWTRDELRDLDTVARLLVELMQTAGLPSDTEPQPSPDAAQKLAEAGLLASRMAHDFNNMLSVISGYSELLMEELEPSSSQHAAAAQIHTAATRAASWTGQLLIMTGGTGPGAEADPAAGADPKPIEPEPAQQQTVLLVDDQESVRDVVSLILNDAGYAVLTASGGAEALAVAASHAGRVDLLLTDMVMPGGMNGRELAAALAGLYPGLPVILMSGYTDDANVRDAISRRELAFIPKPFRPGELLRTVREVMANGLAGESLPPGDAPG